MSKVAQVQLETYSRSIPKALDRLGDSKSLPQDGLIIIKPNLTVSSRPPVTTDVAAVEAVYQYCRQHSEAGIAIGEGVGSGRTEDVYAELGYLDLAQRYDIPLIDFNEAECVTLEHPQARQLKKLHLPKVTLDAFIISVPVLKDHTFTKTTIAMKNMFGLAPARYYAGAWNKSQLHSPSTDEAVVDLCLYKRPDLSVVDASVALTGSHLSGTPKSIGLILASFDPVAVDAVGSRLLGHNPTSLRYLERANGLLGTMDDVEIVTD